MLFERRIVDNRTFLLGLDRLYREAVKQHERGELLICARTVAAAVGATPADVPVEGYYAEDPRLAEYFRLMRALQNVDARVKPSISSLPEFMRLMDVTSAPVYGRPQQRSQLLPQAHDALSEALLRTRPKWTLARLTEVAFESAQDLDDFSLVGLAARIRETVVLAAVRESVVLYAARVPMAALFQWKRSPRYVWKVDVDLIMQARRFVEAFNTLFNDELPMPHPDQAERYWHACHDNHVVGRCVCLGYDEGRPTRYYHWVIHPSADGLEVHDFWDLKLWTTNMYCAKDDVDHGLPHQAG